MDRDKIIEELVTNPKYRYFIKDVLHTYLTAHKKTAAEWEKVIEEDKVKVPKIKPVKPVIIKVDLNTLDEILEAVDSGKKVFCMSEYYDVIKDKFGCYLIVCNVNKHTVGLTGAKGTEWERTLNGRDFYYEEEKETKKIVN